MSATEGDSESGGGKPSLAVLLRAWRERALLSQELVASRSGLGVRTIRRLEAGEITRPRGKSLRLLADALELSDAEWADLAAAARDGPPPREPGARFVARQLPADVAGFVGRASQLQRMDGLLTGGGTLATVVIVVSGTAGVGKTALAVHWAHRVADRFPDGQLFVNLRGFDPSGMPVSPAQAIRGFLDAFDVAADRVPSELPAQAALYRSLLAGRRVLVVLDNARDLDQVHPLLPGTAGCVAVVTSRDQLTGLAATHGAHPLVLDLMSTVEARQLLAARLGADRVAAEPQATDAIVARCARLPLALAVVAARAATHPAFPLATLAGELGRTDGRLNALAGGDAAVDVRTALSWSYRTLSADGARLFRLLGLHPGPDVSPPAAASLAGTTPRQVRPLLAELARAHLVTEHVPGRYAMHDLLRAYAAELAHGDPAQQRRDAIHRMFDHYLHTANTAARILAPQRDPITLTPPRHGVSGEGLVDLEQALAWFTTERPVLLAAIRQASSMGLDAYVWRLGWTMPPFLDRRGHLQDWAEAQQAALNAAQRMADLAAQAYSHGSLGSACTQLNDWERAHAHLRRALDLYGRLGDVSGLAHTHLDLDWLHERQGNHQPALHHARQALELYRANGRRSGQVRALNNIGWHLANLGDHEQSLGYCRQALEINRQSGSMWTEATCLDSLGYAYHQLGSYHEAIAHYQRALDLHRVVGDRVSEAQALTHLGEAHKDVGDHAAARAALLDAVAILDELDHPDARQVRAKLLLVQDL